MKSPPPVPVQPAGEHSACFSFSAADRWLGTEDDPGCTASVWWGLEVPARPAGEAAIEGTRLHRLAEQLLREEIALEDLDEADRELLSPLTDCDIPDDALIEERVGLPRIDADLYGTADVIWLDDRQVMHVWDHKFGYIEAGWLQLKLYALAACDGRARPVDLHIFQPKQGGIKTLEVEPEAQAALKERVKEAVRQVRDGDAVYNPGNRCKYCPAITQCPAVDDMVSGAQAKAGALSPQELSDALRRLPVLKAFIASVEEEALQCASSGVTVPGFKLVAKQARRSWVSESAVLRWGLAHGVNLTKASLISPAQAEKLLKAEGLQPDEEWSKLSTKSSSGNVLVPESDKREEVIQDDVAKRAMKSAALAEWRNQAETTMKW